MTPDTEYRDVPGASSATAPTERQQNEDNRRTTTKLMPSIV